MSASRGLVEKRIGSGGTWRWVRRFTQLLAPLAILISPLLGGWQRLDRNHLAGWDGHGWDLPAPLLDRLPLGDAPGAAYDAIVMSGGGTAVDYFSIPLVDPVGGTLALVAGADFTGRTLLAWGLVVALAVIAGRMFCGWFCPFGTLARGLEFLLERLPWQPPRYAPPRRRWLRFVLLAGAIVAGALGAQLALYLLLPHWLVQQAGYGLWLMGGFGAASGALLGLVAAGVVFGPTTYCTTVCPTGAALALAGSKRVVRLTLVEPTACGNHCDLCDQACWLSLHPSQGDPGSDCDLCGRCTEVCPHDNLGIANRRHLRTVGQAGSAAAAAFVLAWLCAAPARAASPTTTDEDRVHPRLVLESARHVEEVDVVVSIVDLTDIELDANDEVALEGCEVSVYLARGEPEAPDRIGRQQPRDTYAGPLVVMLRDSAGVERQRLEFERPNYPVSTPNRTIYRKRIPWTPAAGDSLVVSPVEGWLTEAVEWEIPAVRADGPGRTLGFALGAGLLFAGLLSLSLASRTSTAKEAA